MLCVNLVHVAGLDKKSHWGGLDKNWLLIIHVFYTKVEHIRIPERYSSIVHVLHSYRYFNVKSHAMTSVILDLVYHVYAAKMYCESFECTNFVVFGVQCIWHTCSYTCIYFLHTCILYQWHFAQSCDLCLKLVSFLNAGIYSWNSVLWHSGITLWWRRREVVCHLHRMQPVSINDKLDKHNIHITSSQAS